MSLDSLKNLNTLKEASEILNIHEHTIKYNIKNGSLKEGIDYKKIAGLILLDVKGLGRFNNNLVGSKEVCNVCNISNALLTKHKKNNILIEDVHYKKIGTKTIYDLEKIKDIYYNSFKYKMKNNIKNIVGERFGKLEVVEFVGTEKNRSIWKCLCVCGNEIITTRDHLQTGDTQSCGCSHIKILEKNRKIIMIEDTNIARISSNKLAKNNKSGIKGVFLDTETGKWVATINFKKKCHKLGKFKKKEDAINARKEAEEKLHKKFLREKGIID